MSTQFASMRVHSCAVLAHLAQHPETVELTIRWHVWQAGSPPMSTNAPLVTPEVSDVVDETNMHKDGSVRSVQTATVEMPAGELEKLWEPTYIERLARTYWRYLTKFTLGLVRVKYREDGREVVLLTRPFKLLSFHAPEYELGVDQSSVTWRIAGGILVAKKGEGWLKIGVRRLPAWEGTPPGKARIRVDVEVSNFYPRIAESISSRLYQATQSRIHVIVCTRFLKSLARGDLEPSVAGRFADES